MRPRVFPAEDGVGEAIHEAGGPASMRPRVFPAEDVADRRHPPGHPRSFNEAAGIPRGRRVPALAATRSGAASMRPRVFPAEDRRRREHRDAQLRGASMRPRVFPAEDGVYVTCRPVVAELQ